MSCGCGNGVYVGRYCMGYICNKSSINCLNLGRSTPWYSMINFGRTKDVTCWVVKCSLACPVRTTMATSKTKAVQNLLEQDGTTSVRTINFSRQLKKSDKTEKPILIDGNLTALCAWCCPKLSKLFSLFSEEILVRTSWRRKHVRGSPTYPG